MTSEKNPEGLEFVAAGNLAGGDDIDVIMTGRWTEADAGDGDQ